MASPPCHPPQDRTCVSGVTCEVDAIASTTSLIGDSVYVLATCGLGSHAEGLPTSGLLRWTPDGSQRLRSQAVITAAGGEYRLCWCSRVKGSCAVPSEAGVDLGRLVVVGPAPLDQHRTCVSGRTCAVRGSLGQHLMPLDTVLLMDTCGAPHAIAQVPLVLLEAAAPQAAAPYLTAAGGRYQMCWCAGGLACGIASDFRVSMGARGESCLGVS